MKYLKVIKRYFVLTAFEFSFRIARFPICTFLWFFLFRWFIVLKSSMPQKAWTEVSVLIPGLNLYLVFLFEGGNALS
jgi:hypothetical protein